MKKREKIILIAVTVLIALPLLFFIMIYCGIFGHLQTRQELLNYKNEEASTVLSAEGELIGKFYSENRTNITWDQLPSNLIDALIATEDNRFYEHEGVDTKSLARVLLKSILLNRPGSGGGSTITQQLVKNMFGRKSNGVFSLIIHKTREAILAHRLERTYTKREILTLYLNTVSFGENIFGIETAALRYFNKNAENLRTEESAVLVGMLKATTRYNPVLHPENAINRRNVVLRQMEKYKYLDPAVTDSLCRLPLKTDQNKDIREGPADYFLVQVKKEVTDILDDIYSETGSKWEPEKDGLVITTTLSHSLQEYARRSFSTHLAIMQKRLDEQYRSPSGRMQLDEITEAILREKNLYHRADEIIRQTVFRLSGSYSDSLSVRDSIKRALTLLHAGLLAIDPNTGAIKAWVGGIDFRTQPYDQILARRQTGSVFKPILYALAFEEGMEPCHYLDNDSVTLSGYDEWSPENFDHSYGGKYSLAGALAHSMNIPTFSLFLKLGFGKLDSLWNEMGFSFKLNRTPALALGTAEATIREIAVAYSSFANGGYKIKPWSIISITSPDVKIIYSNDYVNPASRILSERTSILTGAILQKAVEEGTGASLRSVYGVNAPFAGKTGTSQNYSDAWFAAFNPKLTIVARAGASTPLIHFNNNSYGTGSKLALPLVALTLKQTESDPETKNQFIAPFRMLPPDLAGALNCPDFKKDNFIDKLIDLFRDKEIKFDEETGRTKKKRKSLFEIIFGK